MKKTRALEEEPAEAQQKEQMWWKLRHEKGRGVRAMLRALREKGETIPRAEAGRCLGSALCCSDTLFRAVLRACPPGEYADTETLPCGKRALPVELYGTIPTLAAARGETEKLRMLLQRGMDCNAFSFDACAALQQSVETVPNAFELWIRRCSEHHGWMLRTVRGGCLYSVAWCWNRIDGLTPLAAAILYGQADCVRLLLAQPGIAVAESSAVGAAALLAARGTKAQRECACLAFGLPEKTRDIAKKLCADTALQPEVVAKYCGAEGLRRRLTCPGATAAEARALLLDCRADWEQRWLNQGEPNLVLTALEVWPALLEEDAIRDVILRMVLQNAANVDAAGGLELIFLKGKQTAHGLLPWAERMLELWHESAGKERDITAGLPLLAGRKRALDLLAEGGGTLVAAADRADCERFEWQDAKELAALLRRVRFYRVAEGGSSSIVRGVLQTGNARLIKLALQSGLFAGENRAALLEPAREHAMSAPTRAAILMQPAPPQLRPPREGIAYRGGSAQTTDVPERSPVPWLSVAAPDAAAYCGGDTALLALLSERPCRNGNGVWQDAYQSAFFFIPLRGDEDETRSLYCSPLCLAAAAGSGAAVRFLLERGADPEERDWPLRSVLETDLPDGGRARQAVTPLAMAYFFENDEAAAPLEAAGADRALAERVCAELRKARKGEKMR